MCNTRHIIEIVNSEIFYFIFLAVTDNQVLVKTMYWGGGLRLQSSKVGQGRFSGHFLRNSSSRSFSLAINSIVYWGFFRVDDTTVSWCVDGFDEVSDGVVSDSEGDTVLLCLLKLAVRNVSDKRVKYLIASSSARLMAGTSCFCCDTMLRNASWRFSGVGSWPFLTNSCCANNKFCYTNYNNFNKGVKELPFVPIVSVLL